MSSLTTLYLSKSRSGSSAEEARRRDRVDTPGRHNMEQAARTCPIEYRG